MASSANYENIIYAAVKSKLLSELSDIIAHGQIYEGDHENIPYARFPALMLSVPRVTLIERNSDVEKLSMAVTVRYIEDHWNERNGLTDSRQGLLVLLRRIDSAIWAGAVQSPPFGVGTNSNIYNLSVVSVGNFSIEDFTLEGGGGPYRQISTTFEVEYRIKDADR